MHTFQRHKVRPRETHSTTRLHRACRPWNTLFLIALYVVPLSLVLSLLLPHPHPCIPDRDVSLGTIPFWERSKHMYDGRAYVLFKRSSLHATSTARKTIRART